MLGNLISADVITAVWLHHSCLDVKAEGLVKKLWTVCRGSYRDYNSWDLYNITFEKILMFNV